MRQWERIDWDEFRTALNKRPIELREKNNAIRLEKILGTFYNNINKCLDKISPLKDAKVVDKNNPWWTEKLREKRKRVDTLYKKTKQIQNTA